MQPPVELARAGQRQRRALVDGHRHALARGARRGVPPRGRLKIAERLSRQRPRSAGDLNICIQVNIDDETGKAGVAAADVAELAHAVSELPGLRLRGLMCLPAIRQDFMEQRQPFAKMRKLKASLEESGISLDTLSMGMTADYRAAIHEGATLVRIGTALFGARD